MVVFAVPPFIEIMEVIIRRRELACPDNCGNLAGTTDRRPDQGDKTTL